MVEKAAAWKALAEKHGKSLPAVALAFAGLPVCVNKICIGMGAEEEVAQNVAAAAEAGTVPAAIWAEAKAAGLLDEGVPTPAL